MAAKAEVLKVSTATRAPSTGRRPQIAQAIRTWFQKGQLGASSMTEMGRYTGGRI